MYFDFDFEFVSSRLLSISTRRRWTTRGGLGRRHIAAGPPGELHHALAELATEAERLKIKKFKVINLKSLYK